MQRDEMRWNGVRMNRIWWHLAWSVQFVQGLGFPEDAGFHDVYGFDDELLAMVPTPVLAVLLLFPITPEVGMKGMYRVLFFLRFLSLVSMSIATCTVTSALDLFTVFLACTACVCCELNTDQLGNFISLRQRVWQSKVESQRRAKK